MRMSCDARFEQIFTFWHIEKFQYFLYITFSNKISIKYINYTYWRNSILLKLLVVNALIWNFFSISWYFWNKFHNFFITTNTVLDSRKCCEKLEQAAILYLCKRYFFFFSDQSRKILRLVEKRMDSSPSRSRNHNNSSPDLYLAKGLPGHFGGGVNQLDLSQRVSIFGSLNMSIYNTVTV